MIRNMAALDDPAAPVLHGGDLLDLLTGCVSTSQRVGAALEELIEHPHRHVGGVVRRSVVTASAPPWNSQAAYLVTDLQLLARRLEATLRAYAGASLTRGGSDGNTALALQALPNLAPAAPVLVVRDVWFQLDGWCLRGRTALGEVEPLTLLPRLPGQSEPRCPWCRFQTLRYQALAGLVRCVNPECRDFTGMRPVGRIEVGRLSSQPLLVWQDGSMGLAE